MFGFNSDLENQFDTSDLAHVRDQADELGIDTSACVGNLEDLEPEQAKQALEDLQAAIANEMAERQAAIDRLDAEAQAEAQRQRMPSCHIGPYSGGWCVICGGRDPN